MPLVFELSSAAVSLHVECKYSPRSLSAGNSSIMRLIILAQSNFQPKFHTCHTCILKFCAICSAGSTQPV